MTLKDALLLEGHLAGTEAYRKEWNKRYHAEAYLLRKGAPLERVKRGETRAAGKLRAKYGITPIELNAMFDKAKDACEICFRTVQRHGTGAFKSEIGHVDHCHTTGKVRGILCTQCNQALGLLKDKPHLATSYLERTNA